MSQSRSTRTRARKSKASPLTLRQLYAALVRSESQLRATLYSIGDAVIATDAKGRVTMMNPVAERLTGWREDEACGKPLADVFRIVNEETRAPVEDPVTRVLRDGTVIGLGNHTLLLARDGREIPIADAGAPIHDARGKIVGVVLVFRDQTAERAAQRAVQEAREYAESIVATARDPLIVLDANLRVVSANRAFYHVFATTPAETEGRLLYELGNRQWDIPELRRLLEDILPQNTSFDDYRVTHDFECIGTRTMLLNARRIHREGKADLILLAIEDITARQIAEDALRASEERYRKLYESAPFIIYELSLTGTFTGLNPAFETTTGWAAEEWIGRSFMDLIHPDDRAFVWREFERAVKDETHTYSEMRILAKNGKTLTMEVLGAAQYRNGQVVGVYGFARDVTERKRHERELEAHARIAQALGETQDLQPLLERLLAAAIHAIPAAEKGSAALLSDAEHLQVCALYGYQDVSVLGFTYPLTWGYAGRAARERHPLLIADVQADAELQADAAYISIPEVQAIRSAVAVPLLVSENIIGVLSLESTQSNVFDEHDLHILTNIATTAALIIERRRLFEETQRRLRELEILQELSAALRQAHTAEEMIPIFVQHAVQALRADAGSIYLREESSGDWVSRGWINAHGEWVTTAATIRHRAHEGVTGHVGNTGEIYVTCDWRTDSLTVRLPEEEPLLRALQCGISLPLRTETEIIGVLHVWFAQVHDFSEAEKCLLVAIADMAGNALQRARLFEETQRHAEKIVAVNALGRALATTLDLPTLCRTAHQHIRTLVACDNLCITLYDAATRTLRPAYVLSEGQELDVSLFPPLTIDPHAPRAGRAQAILDAQTVILNDLAEKSRQSGRILVGSATEPQSAVYTPMLVEGKVIGLLELQSYRNYAYSPDDLDLLQMIANQIGLAIQNARLFAETRARLNELNTLHQASQTLLTSALDLEATYVAIHQAIARVMPCEALSIVLEDEAQGDYHGVYLYDKSGHCPAQRIPRGTGLSGIVIPSGKTLVIDDYAAQSKIRAVHFGDPEHVRSILAVPLRRGDKTIGMVATQAYQPHAFTNEHRVLLETLAAQFATSIENARLYEQTRARVRELEVIAAVSRALSAASTRAEMYTAVLDQLVPALNVDGGLIETLDPASGELLIQAARGVGESLIGRRIPRGASLSAYVLETGKPYFNNDARSDPLLFDAQVFGECRAAAGVPMRIGTQILGLVWLASRRALTDDDVRVLTAIADITANALHRAALHEQTERQVRRLSALRAIDRVISSSFDVRVTLAIILEHTLTELKVDAVNVLVHHPHTHVLEYAASRGFRTRAVEQTRVHCGEGLAGRVALERQTLHLTDLTTRAQGAIIKELVDEGYTEYYGVPLIAKGNVVGVMEIFNRTPLPRDPEWHAFCETLAGQAAIAIDNARLFGELQQSHTDLILAYDATIEGWSRALELRDKETEGHTERVTEMTLRLARAFGFREDEIVHIRRGALMHDIGKIAIPDAILHKPGKLTDEEWTLMREHPRRAYEMLLPIAYLRPALDIPYCHHERWDGTGYPRGLKGEEIPLAARLFAVVDVYDALISNRPYRQAWSRQDALEYIREQAGKCFDPRVVEVFLQMTKDE